MRSSRKSIYSLRKLLPKSTQSMAITKALSTPNRGMGRTARNEKVKTGVKRTRGRPRTKDAKPTVAAKRRKPSLPASTNGTKSPAREASLSPTHQEPPQLELMSTVEEYDDLDIPISYSSLISIDDHLCPGMCIVICPIANCQKKFSNPIDLVSHLRIHHESDTFSSVKIFICPICLKTRFSSHTASSDLTLLSEHAERYHGQTLKLGEFIYFCTIALDVATDDKTAQKQEENNHLKKEACCIVQQPNPDSQYLSILPLIPNCAAAQINADAKPAKVERATADNLGLRMSSSASHFIQISPMSQRLTDGSINAAIKGSTAPQPVLATLTARINGQLSPGGPPTVLLSSSPPSNAVTAPTPSEEPILISPNGSICVSSHSAKPLSVLNNSSPTAQTPASDVNQTNTSTRCLQPKSSSTAAAIAALKQLMQSASAAVKSQQLPSAVITTPAVAFSAADTASSTASSVRASNVQPSVVCATRMVTKVEQPSATLPSHPFVQEGSMRASLGAELDPYSDLNSFTFANADLLTLARLSVKQASVEANNKSSLTGSKNGGSNQETPLTPSLPSQLKSSPVSRNRRLLPRKVISITAFDTTSTPLRKRVALPPLAVKPPKELTSFTGNAVVQPTAHQQSQISTHFPLAGSGGGVDGMATSEEAPVMTAALINPSCSSSAATTTLIPSSLGNMLTKSRLLQASTPPPIYINVRPRPAPLSSAPSTSSPHQQPSYQQQPQHPIHRTVPILRPAPLQKILPRPNTTVASVINHVTSTASTTSGGKEVGPLLYSMQTPLIAQTPATMSTNAIAMTQVDSGGSSMASTTSTPIKASAAVYFSQVNGNGAVLTNMASATAIVNNATPPDGGSSALIICTSPSELNIST